MKKILVFGASSSKESINRRLALYAASNLSEFEIVDLDLNNFEMPIFSVDKERENGIPQAARDFKSHIHACEAIIISFAEHNGSYSAAFKNLFDWASRVEKNMWLERPMLLLATSPGARGGQSVLETAVARFPFMGGQVIASFSLPSFNSNFHVENGITDPELSDKFTAALSKFAQVLEQA